jgi:hypothetical protein
MISPQVAGAICQSDPNPSGFNSQTSIQPKFLSYRTSCLIASPPTSSNSPSLEHVKAFCHNENPESLSTSPVLVYKAPFTISSNAFRTQEWSDLSRDNVLRLLKTLPLVSFLFGWLLGKWLVVRMGENRNSWP